MCAREMLSALVLVVTCVKLANSDVKLETCTPSHQVTALELFSKHSCQPRQEVVQLELPSDLNIVQVRLTHAPESVHFLAGKFGS